MTSNSGPVGSGYESRNLTYNIVQDTNPVTMVNKVNALLIAGWFLIGGLGYGDGLYTQAMGIRIEDFEGKLL